MNKTVIVLLFLCSSSYAENSKICDEYYKNYSHYLDIMAKHGNAMSEINKLTASVKKSQFDLERIKKQDKEEICRSKNNEMLSLIDKFK